MHFPGQNFTGPGTHIVTHLLNHKMPANKTDFATMLHDIDYLRTAGHPELQRQVDDRAIHNSEWTKIEGLATVAGLSLRKILDLEYNKPMEGYTAEQTQQIGEAAIQYVMNDPHYYKLFDYYGVDPSQYTDKIG